MHNPESSDITGKSTNFEKYFTLSLELEINDLPVSLGLLMPNDDGEIFFSFLAINKLFL